MKVNNTLIVVSFLVLIAGCGGPGENAEIPKAQPAGSTSADIGEYVVHFSAQSTDSLPPEIAGVYNIARSKNRAMLNVSVIRESDGVPVPATISVKTVNLTGQLKNVTMRMIEEPGNPSDPGDAGAIYYIGVTPVANRETLNFDISVTPEGATRASQVRFQREFFTD